MELGITFYVLLYVGALLGLAPLIKNPSRKLVAVLIGVSVAAVVVTLYPIPETTLMITLHVGAIIVPVIACGVIRLFLKPFRVKKSSA